MNPKKILRLPEYKRHRWIEFKKYTCQPSVVEAMTRYQLEYKGSGLMPLWAMGDMVNNYLPHGCDKAYSALLDNPDISEQELVDLIEPPIEIISHADKHIGLNKNPSAAYQRYMYRVVDEAQPDDVDPLFEGDTSLYLRIAPYTKPTEIINFITTHYEKEMWPHLQTQPNWDNSRSEYLTKRNSVLRQSVADSEPLLQRILVLHAEGKKSPAIAKIISTEFGKDIDQANIRKMISQANKKRKL